MAVECYYAPIKKDTNTQAAGTHKYTQKVSQRLIVKKKFLTQANDKKNGS